MKGSRTTSLSLLTFVFLSHSALGDDCSFARIHEEYDPDRAQLDAQAVAQEGDFRFIGVADGIGPSRPGFEGVPLTRCLMLDAEWEMLWVGADATSCKDGKILKRKATEYSKLFNTEMLRLAAADPSFMCSSDLKSSQDTEE